MVNPDHVMPWWGPYLGLLEYILYAVVLFKLAREFVRWATGSLKKFREEQVHLEAASYQDTLQYDQDFDGHNNS